jgi:hypothetical protein
LAAATTVGVITCRAKLRARACSGMAAERTTSVFELTHLRGTR